MTTNTKWREARARDVLMAYKAGEKNLTRLAARFGVSRQTVRRDLAAHDVVPNPRRVRVEPPAEIVSAATWFIGPELKTEMEKIAPQTFTEARAAARQKVDGELAPWERELLNRVPVEPPAEVVKEVERLFSGNDRFEPRRLKPWEKRIAKLEAQLSDLTDKVKSLEDRLPQVTYTRIQPLPGSAMTPGTTYTISIPATTTAMASPFSSGSAFTTEVR